MSLRAFKYLTLSLTLISTLIVAFYSIKENNSIFMNLIDIVISIVSFFLYYCLILKRYFDVDPFKKRYPTNSFDLFLSFNDGIFIILWLAAFVLSIIFISSTASLIQSIIFGFSMTIIFVGWMVFLILSIVHDILF